MLIRLVDLLKLCLLFILCACGNQVEFTANFPNPTPNNPAVSILPSFTNSTTLNLTYANFSSSYDQYCLLENDSDILNCSWTAGVLPGTFTSDSTEEAKVISVWTRSSGIPNTRVDSNSVTLDVTDPVLNLTSLTGGQSLTGGAVVTITWTGSDLNPGTAPIKLEYSANNGTTWTTIVNATANTGTYSWTLPSVTSVQYLVRITMTDAATNTASDVSSTNFSVNASSPVISVTAPNGSEFYRGGSSRSITWTSSGLPAGAATIDLDYTVDGTNFISIAMGEANDGTYSWTVPGIDSGSVRVRATVNDSFAVATGDLSNANFTIDSTAPSAPSSLALQTPSASPNVSATPIIRIGGVVSGDSVSLFSDSSCSTLRGSGTASGATIDITSSSLVNGTYDFYSR